MNRDICTVPEISKLNYLSSSLIEYFDTKEDFQKMADHVVNKFEELLPGHYLNIATCIVSADWDRESRKWLANVDMQMDYAKTIEKIIDDYIDKNC